MSCITTGSIVLARLPMKHIVSAGGVVYRCVQNRPEILLVGHSETGVWGLPKGGPSRGETAEKAALREVGEETGLQVEIEEPLGDVHYWFTRVSEGFRFSKTVHYFLMRPVGGDISLHDWEHDRVAWFPLEEALKIMTYKNETEVVRKAGELIRRKQACRALAGTGEKESDAA